jgi:hypothetical protein
VEGSPVRLRASTSRIFVTLRISSHTYGRVDVGKRLSSFFVVTFLHHQSLPGSQIGGFKEYQELYDAEGKRKVCFMQNQGIDLNWER